MKTLSKILNVKDQDNNDIDVTKASEQTLFEVLTQLQFGTCDLTAVIRHTEKELSSLKKEMDKMLMDLEIVEAQLDSLHAVKEGDLS